MYLNNIRKYRLEQGLKLIGLSEKTSLSASYLCHLEKGTRKNPSIKVMEIISEKLNKTVSEVFFDEGII